MLAGSFRHVLGAAALSWRSKQIVNHVPEDVVAEV